MASLPGTPVDRIDYDYQLEDRYVRETGRLFMSGSQALVRLPMLQHRRDAAVGLNTAGFISGYTGSPLGGYDIALKQASRHLERNQIFFKPGINEDMAATSVWGSQQVALVGKARYDGVFGIWYGKGPGVDRSGDALKHGSYSGSAPNGGVIVLAGDDHGAKSSTIAHQSDHAFIHFGMPYFNPATVQDYIDLGIHGFALSRFSGCWVGMKCVTDTIESSASVDIDPDRIKISLPENPDQKGSLNARWMVPALIAEKRHYQERMPAVLAYVKLNRLNKVVLSSPLKTLAIVTTGKAFLDVMQALADLGLDEGRCAALGISVMKVVMPWPLEPDTILEFVEGNREVLVIEEKRDIIEQQLASLLVNRPDHPVLTGKRDPDGASLVPTEGELAPAILSRTIGSRIVALTGDEEISARLGVQGRGNSRALTASSGLVRMPRVRTH